jgi:hypothetical protein
LKARDEDWYRILNSPMVVPASGVTVTGADTVRRLYGECLSGVGAGSKTQLRE